MTAPVKLVGFAAALVLAFGGAAVAGGAIDPESDREAKPVHPAHETQGGTMAPEARPVGEDATFATEGRYRLFLQFKHDGDVRTAAFTQEVR